MKRGRSYPMQHTLLGGRLSAGDGYIFKRHDGHAVTIDDFVAAMEDANGQDLTQFKLWYSQAGTRSADHAALRCRQINLSNDAILPANAGKRFKITFRSYSHCIICTNGRANSVNGGCVSVI